MGAQQETSPSAEGNCGAVEGARLPQGLASCPLLLHPFQTALTLSCPSREELNLAVLHAFVDLHEFTDLNLVQALR